MSSETNHSRPAGPAAAATTHHAPACATHREHQHSHGVTPMPPHSLQFSSVLSGISSPMAGATLAATATAGSTQTTCLRLILMRGTGCSSSGDALLVEPVRFGQDTRYYLESPIEICPIDTHQRCCTSQHMLVTSALAPRRRPVIWGSICSWHSGEKKESSWNLPGTVSSKVSWRRCVATEQAKTGGAHKTRFRSIDGSFDQSYS